MTPVSLEAFIHEYRLTYPIGVDKTLAGSPIPETMQKYRHRTGSGLPTSPTSGQPRAGSMWRRSSTCFHGGWWAGR
jgi:hypothetical protein